MSASAVGVRLTTTKYQLRSGVPIPPKASSGSHFKDPALIVAVDSMRVGDCLGPLDRGERSRVVVRLLGRYGKGGAVQRRHSDGTYTIWRVK